MFKINDKVIYKRDVCVIKNIKEDKLIGKYYVLTPIDDESLIINISVDNKMGWLRPIASKKRIEEIIKLIPEIDTMDNINEKIMEQEYKKLLKSGTYEDLIKIVKTTYKRNETRLNNNKKASERDTLYFEKAERMFYNEIAVALNLSYDEAKAYVIKKVEESSN